MLKDYLLTQLAFKLLGSQTNWARSETKIIQFS